MLGFKIIIGHEEIINNLKKSIKNNKVSHAYLIVGEDDSGKLTLAKAFAMALQCTNIDPNANIEDIDACGVCNSCKQFMSDNHPDVVYVQMTKNKFSIGIDDIREQVNEDIIIKPYSSRYKIYIIDKAESLSEEAQNGLLKTLEEPPEYAIIILLSNNLERILETVQSRSVYLNIRAVDKKLIKGYLMSEYKVPDYKAELNATFAQGNVGKAINFALNESFEDTIEEVVKVLEKINSFDNNEIIETAKNLTKDKDRNNVIDVLDLMFLWYRDVLIYKVTKNPNLILYKEKLNDISEQGKTVSFEEIQKILNSIEETKGKIKMNVNMETTLQLMLFTIKESNND